MWYLLRQKKVLRRYKSKTEQIIIIGLVVYDHERRYVAKKESKYTKKRNTISKESERISNAVNSHAEG